MQDPDPMPWGALDRYQAHCIVRMPEHDCSAASAKTDVFIRTRLCTSGHFAAKRIESVSWDGTEHPLLRSLCTDTDLNDMISRQSVRDASIWVEQTADCFRIHGKWNDAASFEITGDLFEIYDRIAGHIRKICLHPTSPD